MFTKKGRIEKIKRVWTVILSCSMLAASLAGCGKDDGSANNTGNTSSINRNEAGTNDAQTPDSVAMGRYVEEIVDLSDRTDWARDIYLLESGELLITDYDGDFLISADNGVTWEDETDARNWRDSLPGQDAIESLAVGADRTIAVIYDVEQLDPSSEDYNPFDLKTEFMIVKPDGTQTPVEVSLTEEEDSFSQVWISDQGRIFASTFGQNLYEIKEDGSGEVFLTLEETPILIRFQDNLMILDGWEYEELLIYDMEAREYIEDEVLGDFIRENYKKRSANGGSYYDMYFFMGEENILYLAGNKGLYRHVIGGSAIEQVVDGKLSIFNNPSYTLRGMLITNNSEFIALFSGGQVVRFTYDPDIPTVPGEKLQVYSLKENATIRQAVTMYQMAYPEVYVEYEVGMAAGSSVTKEDALKSLNTKMMANDGPDVLILDNMPADSYMEKGLLLDLSSLLGSLDGEDALFPNIVDAFRRDGQIYMMPCEVEIPIAYGKESYVSQTADLSGIAKAMEELREANPGDNLFGDCSETGIMRLYSVISVPFWKTESGEIDRDALKDYLTQIKRIYDAQMNGLSEEALAQYNDLIDTMIEIHGYNIYNDSEMAREDLNYMDYLTGQRQIICSLMSNEYEYAALCSIERMAGYEDNELALMGDGVFYPRTLTGISAVSEHVELAEAFLRLLFGKENQLSLFNGFAVNREAFNGIRKEEFEPDEAYSNLTMLDEDGQLTHLVVYWPGETQIGVFRNWMETVTIPYIEDAVLEEAVYEAGAAYLQGTQSLEETLDAIEKKSAIYMAE